jgi:SNF2 family DNA or RNA helicase
MHETIKLIKKYRMFGVPESERTYKVNFINGKKPYEHQWTMWAISMRLNAFANLSQMGTGKTPAVIMTIDSRLQRGDIEKGHILYITPATTLLGLQAHFATYAPHLSVSVIDGTYMERMEKILDKNVDVKLVNPEAFTMKTSLKNKDGQDVILKFSDIVGCNRWDLVVIDEAHKIKNPEAQRTMNIIDTFIDVPYKIIMSGTITANKLYDIVCPFIFLNKARNFSSLLTQRDGEKLLTYGETLGYILRSYFRKEGWGWEALSGTIEELRSKLEECSVRFEKAECMNLPAKVYETRLVDLTPAQAKLYHDLELYLHAEIEDKLGRGEIVGVTHILALNMKLAEAANGWLYDNSGYPINFPENPKVDAALDVLDDIDDGETKVIIWSQFKQDMRLLKDAIAKQYGPYSVAIIDGSVSMERRFTLQNEFNDKKGKLRFVVCNVLAAGTGIDLIGASYEIYFSNSFRKVERSQSEDRAHRPGMQEHLTIIDIVAKNTIDEKVIASLKSNKSMSAALTENLGFDPKLLGIAADSSEDAVIIENGNGKHVEKIHQKQFGKECMLATIANAGNVKLDVVRSYILEKTGRTSWYPYTVDDVLDLMNKYCTKQIADSWATFHKYFYGEGLDYEQSMERRKKIRLDMTEVKVPTSGKGLLFVDFENMPDTHIVYYENGWIYDGNQEDKIEVGKWQALLWDVKGKVCWNGVIE